MPSASTRRAADTVGISVYGIRYGAVVLSGMLAACGGAYLSIGFVNSFNENMTAGRGFIALAAVIFGNWRPFGAAAACVLFGFSSALAQRLPEYSDSAAVLFQALPYVLTLIAVAGVDRSFDPAGSGGPPVQEVVRGNRRAAWSVALGLLATLTMPIAVVATRYSDSYELLHAGFAIPVAVAFGIWARSSSPGVPGHSTEATLGRAGGAKAARMGRLLGILGICVAASATIAVAVYGLLVAVG